MTTATLSDLTRLKAKIEVLWINGDPALVEIARAVDEAHGKYRPDAPASAVPTATAGPARRSLGEGGE